MTNRNNLTRCLGYETFCFVKPAVFHPKARSEIQNFPIEVRRELGMPLSKPIASVSSGVEELRLKDRSGAYRVFYYTKLHNAILIFHAFVKKLKRHQNMKSKSEEKD